MILDIRLWLEGLEDASTTHRISLVILDTNHGPYRALCSFIGVVDPQCFRNPDAPLLVGLFEAIFFLYVAVFQYISIP